ncbi:MAG TPA: hypothetical protein VJU86_07610, partial [Pyrinomonadaceae bacterium]|nr:hypothetical protein [Pyrinomonadaceae bacterium]
HRRCSRISAQGCALATLGTRDQMFLFATLKELPRRANQTRIIATPSELLPNDRHLISQGCQSATLG